MAFRIVRTGRGPLRLTRPVIAVARARAADLARDHSRFSGLGVLAAVALIGAVGATLHTVRLVQEEPDVPSVLVSIRPSAPPAAPPIEQEPIPEAEEALRPEPELPELLPPEPPEPTLAETIAAAPERIEQEVPEPPVQAPSPEFSAAIVAETEAVSSNYWTQVHAAIAREVRYPPRARMRGLEGSASITITIGPAGDLMDLTIVGETDVFGRAVLEAVSDASPYPPPPADMDPPVSLTIPVAFQLR